MGAEDNFFFLFLKSLNYCAILDFLVTCVKALRLKQTYNGSISVRCGSIGV